MFSTQKPKSMKYLPPCWKRRNDNDWRTKKYSNTAELIALLSPLAE